jgi:RNA polymerase sigma factor (sigma-70 family)
VNGPADGLAPGMRFFSRRRVGTDEIHALYQLHGPGLLLYARSLIGRNDAAEDALQQVFTKLLERDQLPEDPKPYLFRAVHNAALNIVRGKDDQVDLNEIENWFETPQTDLTYEIALRTSLMNLPVDQRQVLVLHIWGGLSFEEIANLDPVCRVGVPDPVGIVLRGRNSSRHNRRPPRR